MSNIEDMFKNFKTDVEKNQFVAAQMKTILDLTKKNKQLSDEVADLKKHVVAVVPIISSESSLDLESDDKEIAKIEINKLKSKSLAADPLTLEEAKRLEIYSKILNNNNKKDDKKEREVKEIDVDALIAIAESPDKKELK